MLIIRMSAFLAGISLLFAASTFAKEYDALDHFIEWSKATTQSVSGTSVILIKDGKIVHQLHTGMADVEKKKPVTSESIYYFASTTKAIMGLAILQAEKRGLITKKTSLKQLFPTIEFKYIDASQYTVMDLLSHRSGLINDAMTWTFSYTGEHSERQRMHFIASLKPHPELKKGQFDYSNLGYNLMALWLDNHYPEGWQTAIRDLVLSPAGMTRSTADVDGARKQGWPITKPYSYKFGNGASEIYMHKTNATLYSVGVFARPADWAKLITHLLPINASKSPFPSTVVTDSRALLVDNIDSYFSGYGWGWMHANVAGEEVLMHTGGFDGASVSVSYSANNNLGVVIVHNENGLIANELNRSISDIAYSMLLGKDAKTLIADNKQEMQDTAEFIQQAKVKLAAKRAQLTRASAADTTAMIGRYQHPDAGQLVIVERNGVVHLTWGNLRSDVYAETPDNYLLELRPGKFYPMTYTADDGAIQLKGWQFDKLAD